jgi:O-antigen/teichoic acid export membrane protein
MVSVRAALAKGLSLLSVGVLDFGTPFIRMLILTRLLSLGELGFSTALATVCGTFELITDISIYRFVLSSPRADYEEALACAHALSLLRGFAVAALALLCAPALAYALSPDRDWASFAFLAAIIFGRSFEHLEPRVAERDYRYGGQFKASLAGNGLGLVALVATALLTRNHFAALAFLFAQMVGGVVASHLVSSQPYRLRFRSPYFKRAWAFGYPLMFNGMGLAIAGQGDRLMVGALLGLPALALYSIALLVSIVPIGLLFKVMGSINLAALLNASVEDGQFEARLRLYARATPLIAAAYALGLLALMNVVVPLAFGPKFGVSNWVLVILSLGAFFNIVRTEPFTSLLLHEMRTGTLAVANLSTFSGLGVGTGLTMACRTVLAPLAGRLVGEITGLCTALYLTRRTFRTALADFLMSLAAALTLVLVASITLLTASLKLWPAIVFSACALGIGCTAGFVLPPLLRLGYGRRSARGMETAQRL